MAGGGGREEGYVKRLLRAHSEEGDDGERMEEERRTMVTTPSKEDSWVLRKKASFESMWGGGQSLSLCLPKQDHYVSKTAKEEKEEEAFEAGEEVNEVENPVKQVIKEEEAAPAVTAVAKEIESDKNKISGYEDKSKGAYAIYQEEERKDIGLLEDSTGSQSDSEEKGGDGLNEEARGEVPTPAEEEAVTLVQEKVSPGCTVGGALPVDTVTREEAIR